MERSNRIQIKLNQAGTNSKANPIEKHNSRLSAIETGRLMLNAHENDRPNGKDKATLDTNDRADFNANENVKPTLNQNEIDRANFNANENVKPTLNQNEIDRSNFNANENVKPTLNQNENNRASFNANENDKSTFNSNSNTGLDFNWSFPDIKINQQTSDVQIDESVVVEGESESPYYERTVVASQKYDLHSFLRKIVLPVIVALSVGGLMGFLALNLIKDQTNESPKSVATTTNQASSPLEGTFKKNLKNSMIQAGAFSTEDAAAQQQSTLPAKTPSIVINIDGKFFLFIGVADSLENAKILAQKFTENGINSFWKDIILTGNTKGKFSKDDLAKLTTIHDNFQMLKSALVAVKTGSPIPEMHTQEVEATENDQISKLFSLNQEMLVAFDSYQKGKTADSLVEFEQKLLDFIKMYQSL